MIVNFIIQKLKSKHTSIKKYTNWDKLRRLVNESFVPATQQVCRISSDLQLLLIIGLQPQIPKIRMVFSSRSEQFWKQNTICIFVNNYNTNNDNDKKTNQFLKLIIDL